MQRLINFKGIDLEADKEHDPIKNIRRKDIAIIGLSAKLGGTADTDELWKLLTCGEDSIKPFPENRRTDVKNYLNAMELNSDSVDYHLGAYMEEVDKFDYKFFLISRKEADLIDPNQRVFLETAWKAIEDAGYGGNQLSGKNVGVFLGYSSDFGEEYKKMVQIMDPANTKLSTTGNIKSIISSRLSYLLDLHGPSMVIDTACSSSLVAVHEACRSIRNGECEAAVAGGVKVLMMPVKAESCPEAGIQIINDIASSDGKTKTFDDSSDGTLLGEGVAAVLLKPLNRAIEDKDHIYAVIKGSAVNQDGSSIGITAPNSAAQEEVICAAWKDADIDAETISYIEAHGTGTRLGDTVEINGLERAFRNFTDKKQFCAIGSIKTNIGHLDSTAGMSGLTKAILSLSKKKLPPSLNFTLPNRNIPIVESPVYINDCLADWNIKDIPRRCGISSFGLSGTNCHIVLEEAPVTEAADTDQDLNIFTLSAKSENSMKALIDRYIDYFNSDSAASIGNICYTANTGRGHYEYRLAMPVRGVEELECKLALLYSLDYQYEKVKDVYYGKYKVVYRDKEVMGHGEITEGEKRHSTEQANSLIDQFSMGQATAEQYGTLCSLYVRGADVAWEALYKTGSYARVGLPSYTFEETRCWVENNSDSNKVNHGQDYKISSLIDACIARTMNLEIYMTRFQVDRHWVLSEHKVFGKYVMPGTAYIELIRQVMDKENSGQHLVIKDLKFIAPLALDDGESKEVHLLVRDLGNWTECVITSKDELSDEWIVHVNGEVAYDTNDTDDAPDLDEIRSRFRPEDALDYRHSSESPVKTGPRWDTYSRIFKKTDEYLSYIQLKDIYHKDLLEYIIHPSMMDCAVNTANSFIGDGFYLPFSYKKLKFYGSMPPSFYCYLKRKDKRNSDETPAFDVFFLDEGGKVFLKAEEYIIKKIRMDNIDTWQQKKPDMYHRTGWIKKEAAGSRGNLDAGRVLIFRNASAIGDEVIQELKAMGKETIEVSVDSSFQKISADRYTVGSSQEDYDKLIREIGENLSVIVHMSAVGSNETDESLEQLENELNHGVYSLFYLTKALAANKVKGKKQLFVISDFADYVSDTQYTIKPANSSLKGLLKVIEKEQPGIVCRSIDIDSFISGKELLEEISLKEAPLAVAFRGKMRFAEEFGPVVFSERPDEKARAVEEGGTYVITGGTGGLGLLTAGYIAAEKGVKIALLSRSSLPDKTDWNGITDSKTQHKISAVRSMEAAGAKIECYAADITNYEETKAALDDFRSKYGRIKGVIHCAGMAGDGFLFRKDEEVFRSVIGPKVNGTWILEKLTKTDELDFFVMFSSIAAVVPVAGQGDYTAANSYMDAFAHYMNGQGRKAVSIKWAPWKEIGMAVDYNVDMDKGVFRPVTNTEGISILEKIINTGETGVIAGWLNEECLDQLSDHYMLKDLVYRSARKRKPVRMTGGEKESSTSGSVVITGKQQASLSETEVKISGIWANFLCLDTIDIYESFYDMGGDSLIATALLKEMEKAFPEVLDITDIFTYPTVVDISGYIEQKTMKTGGKASEEQPTIAKIVEMLSENRISPQEADEMIMNIS